MNNTFTSREALSMLLVTKKLLKFHDKDRPHIKLCNTKYNQILFNECHCMLDCSFLNDENWNWILEEQIRP